MWEPLLVDDGLARRIEAALAADLVAFARAMARGEPAGGAGHEPVAGGVVAFTGPGLFGARAQGIGFEGPVADADVDRVVAFLTSRGAPAVFEVCPLVDDALRPRWAERRVRPRGFRNVYAIVDPSAAAEPVTPPVPGLTVEVLAPGTGGAFPRWSQVLLDGFGYRDPARRDRVAAWNAMMAGLPEARLLLARIDGEPVGASNLLVHPLDGGPVASLGGTATLPAHRRRGVQGALLRARIALAAEAGCALAVVTADPGSSSGRNARRVGFTLAYTNARIEVLPGG